MAVFLDGGGGVACVADENLLGADHDLDCVFEGFNVELAVNRSELHEVQRGEVAGGVVEKHVLRTGVGRVDPIRVRTRVPLVDYGVELDSRIAADVGGLGHFSDQVPGLVEVRYLVVCDVPGLPLLVFRYCVHELVGYSDAVVSVLEEDRAVCFAINGSVVACVD